MGPTHPRINILNKIWSTLLLIKDANRPTKLCSKEPIKIDNPGKLASTKFNDYTGLQLSFVYYICLITQYSTAVNILATFYLFRKRSQLGKILTEWSCWKWEPMKQRNGNEKKRRRILTKASQVGIHRKLKLHSQCNEIWTLLVLIYHRVQSTCLPWRFQIK